MIIKTFILPYNKGEILLDNTLEVPSVGDKISLYQDGECKNAVYYKVTTKVYNYSCQNKLFSIDIFLGIK